MDKHTRKLLSVSRVTTLTQKHNTTPINPLCHSHGNHTHSCIIARTLLFFLHYTTTHTRMCDVVDSPTKINRIIPRSPFSADRLLEEPHFGWCYFPLHYKEWHWEISRRMINQIQHNTNMNIALPAQGTRGQLDRLDQHGSYVINTQTVEKVGTTLHL